MAKTWLMSDRAVMTGPARGKTRQPAVGKAYVPQRSPLPAHRARWGNDPWAWKLESDAGHAFQVRYRSLGRSIL